MNEKGEKMTDTFTIRTGEMNFCEQETGIDPEVLGYQILIKGAEIAKKIGGVLIPDSFREEQNKYQNIGMVLKIGPTAFDPERGLDDRKCDVGDWVTYGKFERTALHIGIDQVLYFVSDAHILARHRAEDIPKILRNFV